MVESEATNIGGRPRSITDEMIIEVCDRVADGETIRQIARDDYMPVASTIYLELSRNETFSDQYVKAKEAQLTRWEDELIEIADDGSNDWVDREVDKGRIVTVADTDHMNRSRLRVDTRKWIMSKRAPKKYGDRAVVQGDSDADPVKVAHTMSDEASAMLGEVLGSLRGL